MNYAQFGRRHNLTRQYISLLVRAGRLPTLPDGTLDAETADAALARIKKQPRSPELEAGELRRTLADARLKELKAALMEGRLVDVDWVIDSESRMNAAIKSRILSIPTKLAQAAPPELRLQVKTDSERICKQACEELVTLARNHAGEGK